MSRLLLLFFLIINGLFSVKSEIHDRNTHILQNNLLKREVQDRCYIPGPLVHGQYQLNSRACPIGDNRAICRLVPGTTAPNLWVLYYNCEPQYDLSIVSRASICKSGKWIPSLPVCIPALNLTTREEWGALDESAEFPQQEIPVSRVIIAHTATGSCNTRADCILLAQSIQQYHIQQFGDIGYNFLVGGDGSVIEGQGWDKIGAHTLNYNTGSVCIALIGNFVSASAPPQQMLDVVKKLIEQGVALGKLSGNYKLFAHCQLVQIASPGETVFNYIKNWPHWNAMNAIKCSQ